MDSGTGNGRCKPTIRPASTEEELEKLYSFRYRIYVEEMQRKQKHADHTRRRIHDPLDGFARNFIAWDSAGEVVGALRTNCSRDGDLEGYVSFYDMPSVGSAYPESTSICTRMMIAPQYRRSTLALRLSLAVYECGLPLGIKYNFIDCNDHLVGFFQGLGFCQYMPRQDHEEYGLVTCMRLRLFDLEYLESVSSPFAASLIRWKDEAGMAPQQELVAASA